MSKRKRDEVSSSSSMSGSDEEGSCSSRSSSVSSETSTSGSNFESSSASVFSGSSGSWVETDGDEEEPPHYTSDSDGGEYLEVSSSEEEQPAPPDQRRPQIQLSDNESDSSVAEEDAPTEGWPATEEEMNPAWWYGPMRQNLLDIVNYYVKQLTQSFEGHSGGLEYKRYIWKKCRNYVNALSPPKMYKTVQQCKAKLSQLRSLAKDKTTEFTRELNRSGRGQIAPKYLLSNELKSANDYSGEDVVHGIPGTRESRVYARGSEKDRRYNSRKIYKFNRASRPNYAARVAKGRAKTKQELKKKQAELAEAAATEGDDEADKEPPPTEAEPAGSSGVAAKAQTGKGKGKGKNGNRKEGASPVPRPPRPTPPPPPASRGKGKGRGKRCHPHC